MDACSTDPSTVSPESNAIITELVSAEANLKLQVIQKLIEPCDKATYGQNLKAASETLDCSVRTVQRLVKKWEEEGLAAFAQDGRSDRGAYRISEEWQKFIIGAYDKGKCTPAQVAIKVKNKAKADGLARYPSHMTVYRVLSPLIKRQQQKDSIRNIGWRGSRLALKTRDGEELVVEYSNQVWQCDHTHADILLVDQHSALLKRPWLTTVIDTYSRCIVGFNLGFDAPSSKVVALALRHAILPKQYGSDYKLYADWSAMENQNTFLQMVVKISVLSILNKSACNLDSPAICAIAPLKVASSSDPLALSTRNSWLHYRATPDQMFRSVLKMLKKKLV